MLRLGVSLLDVWAEPQWALAVIRIVCTGYIYISVAMLMPWCMLYMISCTMLFGVCLIVPSFSSGSRGNLCSTCLPAARWRPLLISLLQVTGRVTDGEAPSVAVSCSCAPTVYPGYCSFLFCTCIVLLSLRACSLLFGVGPFSCTFSCTFTLISWDMCISVLRDPIW